MKPVAALPVDPALSALSAIRTLGLAAALPALGLDDQPADLLLRGYTPGKRATLEARVGQRRLAIKMYADSPAPEAELYEALAAAGLAGASGARVPRLLSWDRDLRVLVLSWLEGPTAHELIKAGQGERAGELAGAWIRCAASLPLNLGPPCGVGWALYRAGRSVAALDAADPALGAAAKALTGALARARPTDEAPRLIHGTLYDRHLLDLGDGPGVIDWQRSGQGPLEFDAGWFLATTWRSGLDDDALARAVGGAERAFFAGTAGLLDEQAVAWHRAAALLRLAGKVRVADRSKAEWLARTRELLDEATRLIQPTARPDAVVRAEAPAFGLGSPALELILRALSTRPATPEELDQIRRLLKEARERKP